MELLSRKPVLTAPGATVLLRLLFVLVLPFGDQAATPRLQGLNDDPAHFNYVRYL